MTRAHSIRIATLAGLATTAAVAFVAIARRVFAHGVDKADAEVRDAVLQPAEAAAGKVADATWPTSKTVVQVPVALAVAGGVRRAGGSGAASFAIAGAAAAAAATSRAFEAWLPSRRPPPGRNQDQPSFPSGRALETASIWFTAAYVLAREGLGPVKVLTPLALTYPTAASLSKLARDGHWGSDVVGGWLAGTAIAACCAAGYELAVDRRA